MTTPDNLAQKIADDLDAGAPLEWTEGSKSAKQATPADTKTAIEILRENSTMNARAAGRSIFQKIVD